MDVMLGGKDSLLVGALVTGGKGDGNAAWAASFVRQPGEPLFAVLLQPWIYDQFQGVTWRKEGHSGSNVDASRMAGETTFR